MRANTTRCQCIEIPPKSRGKSRGFQGIQTWAKGLKGRVVPNILIITMPETKPDASTCIGMGYASRPDAFQSGREAAQMAKRQMPHGHMDVVIVFAPDNVRFKDYVEGARLVMGE